MSGFSQALTDDYGDILQGEAKDFLEQINLASRKMSELIDGLLLLSRSTRGELQRDVINLSDLSTSILNELARLDKTRSVSIQVEKNLYVTGDAQMLGVVLRNLLSNAWKYTAQSQNPKISVYTQMDGHEKHYCVKDNGAGFDISHASRLFQPFQRLHRQEEFPGIGIGLATVHRIVTRHGGIIKAHGEPNKGAIFCFTLPSLDDASQSLPTVNNEQT
jgi:light-regulated signal transduction histidine kinase (bacteriophytochrome)